MEMLISVSEQERPQSKRVFRMETHAYRNAQQAEWTQHNVFMHLQVSLYSIKSFNAVTGLQIEWWVGICFATIAMHWGANQSL